MQISLRGQSRMFSSFVGDGTAIDHAVQQAVDTGERINLPINITAMLFQDTEDDPVANFRLTLSMKARTNA